MTRKLSFPTSSTPAKTQKRTAGKTKAKRKTAEKKPVKAKAAAAARVNKTKAAPSKPVDKLETGNGAWATAHVQLGGVKEAQAVAAKGKGGKKYDADVLVIGAGMAGLAATKELQSLGRSAILLEASDRTGGRAYTVDQFGTPIDYGGAWIHGPAGNKLVGLANKLGITRTPTNWGPLYINGRLATPEEERQYHATLSHFESNEDAIAKSGHDEPLSAALPKGAPFADVVSTQYGPFETAMEMSHSSAIDDDSFRSDDSDQLVKEGLGTLVQRFGKDVPVRLNTPVKKITRNADGVEVETAWGEKLRAKRLIITVSAGVLASGKIQFDPPLPQWKQDAIVHLPMGLMNKIVLEFKSNVFGKTKKNTQVAFDGPGDSDKSNMFMLLRPQGGNAAVGFLGGDLAREMENKSDQVAIDMAKAKLVKMFGDKVETEFLKGTETRWGSNPWTLGAYASPDSGYSGMRAKLKKDVDDRIFFAGEAVADAQDAGTVAGAYETGVDAARDAAASLAKQEPLPPGAMPVPAARMSDPN